MSDSAHPSGDMRSRVLSGLAWTGFSQVGMQVTRIAVALLVARLLTPSEYGLAAMALVFSSLVLIFSDLALGAALVQRKTITDMDRNSAFWVSVTSGLLFTVLGVALSGPVARLYGQPDAQPLLAALSCTFLISALAATQQSLMLRDMDFRRLEMLPVAGALIGGAVGVVAAALGAGAWAIITQQIVAITITTILMWVRSDWRPGLQVSRASLRDLWGFSAPLLGQRLLYYVQQNGDRFLIGRFVGTAALGVYAIAYNTILVPAARLGGPLQRVFAPTFSRMQDEPERIAVAWARIMRFVAAVSVPALLGLAVVAPDFVHVVLGDRWREAAPIITILAWVGILQALQSLNVDILMARDRTPTIFRFSLLFTATHVVAFIIGVQWGVIGVAAAYAISSTLVEPALTVVAARALNVSPWMFFRAVSGVFQAGFAMAATVLLTRILLENAGIGVAARLLACIVVGILTFVPLLAWRAPQVTDDVRDLLRRRRGGSTPGPVLTQATALES